MKLKWIAAFVSPCGATIIRVGSISHTKMYNIIASIGHSDAAVEDYMAEGEFTGLYGIEFFREDNAHRLAAREEEIRKEEEWLRLNPLHINPLTLEYD